MTLTLVVSLIAAADPAWSDVDTVDSVHIEARPVDGSKFVELRLSTKVKTSVPRLCEEAYGTGAFDPTEPNLKARKIISETEHQRVTYEQISPPVASNRDYAVRATQEQLEGGGCHVVFEAANDLAPPKPDGWVRITKLKGVWAFRPNADGTTHIEYVIHTDPAGALPAFLVEGSRRKAALAWMKMITARAEKPKRAAP